MKPLLPKELPNFIKRFGNFIDAEIRSIDFISPTTMVVVIACQDSARGFDWLTLNLECIGITDAIILEDSKLSLVDMSDGMSIIYNDGNFAWGVGSYDSISGIKSATSYIISSTIKYEEGLF